MTDSGMLDSGTIEAIVAGRLGDPFGVFGRHGGRLVTFQPGASAVDAIDPAGKRKPARLEPIGATGIFVGPLPAKVAYRLRIDWNGTIEETDDPYRFGPLLGELDLHLLAEGRHRQLANSLGAHVLTIDGTNGVRFAVWAPNARRVSVVGPFNQWDGRRHPMRRRHEAGIWELFVPGLAPGALYKYELIGPWGELLPQKADPVAGAAETPPATASIVPDPRPFPWSDEVWIGERPTRQRRDRPLSVYEVHAASWMRDDGQPLDWFALADRLVPYAAQMGFTHVELLPIMLHPFGGSWGYQPLGQFVPNPALGPPDGFAWFVDRCHRAGLGVILDWVPGHFPNDAHGLGRFDGTALYEHEDPREGMHRDWNTLIYNFGRNEVRGFLIASAVYWLEQFHVDGLRVDAVASMLYRDYSRLPGEWVPNRFGGRENLEAIALMRELSQVVAERCPGTLLIAEESTAWPGVTAPPAASDQALGFDYKWNMGWMHDTLRFMSHEPIHRRFHHHDMTFGMIYAFSEHFLLPLSHDEVVYGKGSLLTKMPGDDWQQFANLRAYFGFMWGHPGKKLLFMGGEFAQRAEWNHDVSLDWHLLDAPAHRGVQGLVRDLNRLHADLPALHARDDSPDGFRWVVGDDADQSVFAFLRFAGIDGAVALVVSNFTPVPRPGYRIGVPGAGRWIERFNSDAVAYGGSGVGNGGVAEADAMPMHGLPASLSLVLPPLATLILTPEAGP